MIMKLEEIEEAWEKDGVFGPDMTDETRRTPKLHNKYYGIYVREYLKLEKMMIELGHLKRLKREHYSGTLDDDIMRERGWKPYPLRILKQDLPEIINDDDEVKTEQLRVAYQKQKVNFLESIIKEIKQRGYSIRAIVDWERFKTGA
jgi:hypothetical protein